MVENVLIYKAVGSQVSIQFILINKPSFQNDIVTLCDIV